MEISSPLINSPPIITRGRCEGFDEVEDAPLWMQYLVPAQPSTSQRPSGIADEYSSTFNDNTNLSTGVEDDLDEKPLWMRYLPNNNIIPKAQPLTNTVGLGVCSASVGTTGSSMRKKIILKRSLNPFGPTSSHAVRVENPIQLTNRKRSMDVEESNDGQGSFEDNLSARRHLRATRPRTVNMAEAAELFSIVNIK